MTIRYVNLAYGNSILIIPMNVEEDDWYTWDYVSTVGIPEPDFGVTEAHTMYEGQEYYFNYPTSHDTWFSSQSYHFVGTSLYIAPSGQVGIVDHLISTTPALAETLRLDTPAGAESGNVLFAVVAIDAYNPYPSSIAMDGWENIETAIGTEGSDPTIILTSWYKYLDNTPDSYYDMTWIEDNRAHGTIIALSGCDINNPIGAYSSSEETTDDFIPVSVEPTADSGVVLSCVGFNRFDLIGRSGVYETTLLISSGTMPTNDCSLGVSYQYPEKFSGLKPYPIGADGPYTHYLDADDDNATDTDNIYGTYEIPRLTYPTVSSLTPGSVVELHGGTFDNSVYFSGSGTKEAPVFVRSNSTNRHVRQRQMVINNAAYHIFENLDINFNQLNRSGFNWENGSDHIVIRNNRFHNLQSLPLSGRSILNMHNDSNYTPINNMVIMGNEFYSLGESNEDLAKQDITCAYFGPGVSSGWLIGNYMHEIGGDGCQCNCEVGYETTGFVAPNHIYIGNNIIHDTRENAVDLKNAHDVIISKNIFHNFGNTSSTGSPNTSSPIRCGLADSTPSGYFRHNIWAIFNHIYDLDSSNAGNTYVQLVRPDPSDPGELPSSGTYFISNLVVSNSGSAAQNSGFSSLYEIDTNIINNTFYNVANPLYVVSQLPSLPSFSGDYCRAFNNICHVGDVVDDQLWYIKNIAVSGAAERSVFSNNLFYGIPSGTDSCYRLRYIAPSGGLLDVNSYTFDEFASVTPDWLVDSADADPKFIDIDTDNFRLQADSPAIGSGINVQYIYDRFYNRYGLDIAFDFDGSPRPSSSAPDIGAFQYV